MSDSNCPNSRGDQSSSVQRLAITYSWAVSFHNSTSESVMVTYVFIHAHLVRSTTPPFDRHDWHVRRANDGTSQRYVIDYYSCPDDENGMPVFSLDVRPAVDTPGAVFERVSEWARVKKEAWSSPQSSQPPLGGQRTGQN